MNPNLTALIKSGFGLFILYWVTAGFIVLPEYIYLLFLKMGWVS